MCCPPGVPNTLQQAADVVSVHPVSGHERYDDWLVQQVLKRYFAVIVHCQLVSASKALSAHSNPYPRGLAGE